MDEGDRLGGELRDRSAEEQRISASLVELERHPGHRLLTQGRLTGVTAARWVNGNAALERLWSDFALYRSTLAQARAIHDERSRLGPEKVQQLRRLLFEATIELECTEVALSERGLTGPAQRVEMITLARLSSRMHAAFDQVSALVTDCGARHEKAVSAIAPWVERLNAARARATELGAECPELGPVTEALRELEGRASGDPLSLEGAAPGLPASHQRALDGVATRLAELAQVRDRWSDHLAELDRGLTELAELAERERAARADAAELTDAGARLAAPVDPLPTVRARRAALDRPGDWAARAVLVGRLRDELARAHLSLAEAVELATGLVERRTELRGRFEAYRARAVRLGLVERDDLVDLEGRIRRMLWTRPAALAAATRAIAEYQRLVRDQAPHGPTGPGTRS